MSTSTSSSSSSSSFYSTPAVSVASGISSKDGQLKAGKKTFSIWDYIPAVSQSSSSGRSHMADCCASSPSQQAQTAAKANKCAMCEKESNGKGQVRAGNTVFFFCNEQHKKEFIAEYNKKHQAMKKPAAPAEAKKGKPLLTVQTLNTKLSKEDEPKEIRVPKLVIRENYEQNSGSSWGVIGRAAQFVANCVSSVVASTKGNESMFF